MDTNSKNDFDSMSEEEIIEKLSELDLLTDLGLVDRIKLLLEDGGDINVIHDYKGGTFLHIACERNDVKAVELLLQKGVDVNAKDNFGCTALHHATLRRNKDIIELLLQNGADVNARDDKGRTALYLGVSKLLQNDMIDIIKYLTNKDADTKLQDHKGNEVSEIVEMIIDIESRIDKEVASEDSNLRIYDNFLVNKARLGRKVMKPEIKSSDDSGSDIIYL